jgi:hypothetical protein
MNENEINDGSSYYLRETTEGFVKIKNPTYYIAKHSDEDLRAAVLAERERIIKILKGIDQTETESEDGYWETSVGAEFGANIIKQIRGRTE